MQFVVTCRPSRRGKRAGKEKDRENIKLNRLCAKEILLLSAFAKQPKQTEQFIKPGNFKVLKSFQYYICDYI